MNRLCGLSESAVHRLQDANRLVLALSGGVDSAVLLDLVHGIAPSRLGAVHVNHHLQPAADRFAEFCLSLGDRYHIDVRVVDVKVEPGGSMEAKARQARYAAFEALLQEQDLLLLAHHADDQLETILFRLFRGGGAFGLEGMPVERQIGRARLFRPLLDLSRQQLLDYATRTGLEWIDDPGNRDMAADRNYIRHKVLPLIEARFPAAGKAMLDSLARDQAAQRDSQASLLACLAKFRPAPDSLELSGLRTVAGKRRLALLRAWLLDLGLPLPGTGLLAELARHIGAERRVRISSRYLEFHQWHGRLMVVRTLPRQLREQFPLAARIAVPGGHITTETVRGRGLRRQNAYDVKFRLGGEKMRIRHNRSLKNLLRENGVPAWLRDRVPLVYAGEELVAVAGLPAWGVPMLVADAWSAGAGEQGLEIAITLADRIL